MKKIILIVSFTLIINTVKGQSLCRNSENSTKTMNTTLVNNVGSVLHKFGDNVQLVDESYRGSCAAKNFVNHSLEILSPNTKRAENVFSNTLCDSSKYRQVAGCLETCLDGPYQEAMQAARTNPVNTFEMMARSSLCNNLNLSGYSPENLKTLRESYRQIAHQMAENAKDYQQGGPKYQALMDKIHQESQKYQKQMLCENGAYSTILFPGHNPEINTVNYSYSVFKTDDYKKAQNLNPANVKSEIEKWNNKISEDQMKILKFCDEAKLQSGVSEYAATINTPRESAIRIDEFKKDNVWSLSGTDANAIINRIQNDPMMAENLKCGRTPHFEVYASSNEKANTGDAAKKFGRWGFDKLSEARAEEIKKQIISKIVLKDAAGITVFNGTDPQDMQNKVTTNLGYKQTGVSGPCPYISSLDSNGKLKILPDPAFDSKSPKADPEKIAELDKAKGVRVTLRFDGSEACNIVTHDQEKLAKKEFDRNVRPNTCFQVAFRCNP